MKITLFNTNTTILPKTDNNVILLKTDDPVALSPEMDDQIQQDTKSSTQCGYIFGHSNKI